MGLGHPQLSPLSVEEMDGTGQAGIEGVDCAQRLQGVIWFGDQRPHQSRLRIVNLLIEKALCVSDVTRVLSLSQSNVSQHLTILHNAGLVSVQREGSFSLYRLTIPEPYQQLMHCLRQSRESFPLLKADLLELRQVTEESEQARC
jgi:ArsR family transcriptional regulator